MIFAVHMERSTMLTATVCHVVSRSRPSRPVAFDATSDCAPLWTAKNHSNGSWTT